MRSRDFESDTFDDGSILPIPRSSAAHHVGPAARRNRSDRAFRLAAVMLACTAACADANDRTRADAAASTGPAVPDLGEAREIASPAGPGSVEPYVSAARDGAFLISWLERADTAAELRFARRAGGAWSEPTRIAASPDFLVNWADFPSLIELSDGRLMAHWLERGGRQGYDVLTALSSDGGAAWTEPSRPHADSVPMPHGFVSLFEVDGSPAAIWLFERPIDGAQPAGHGANVETRLQFTTFHDDGTPRPDQVVDSRACDCCQTDVAATSDGPVIVYRDRTADEVRDIVAVRRTPSGWTEPRVVHADGWRIDGCPVNGPAVAAADRNVAVAWFTAPDGEDPKVLIAFSNDGAASFGEPIRIDEGDPLGRVDVVMLDDGSAAVTWLERAAAGAAVSIRAVAADGTLGEVVRVGDTSDGRPSGFPRMARSGATILIAWTVPGEGGGVRVAELTAGPRP